jgi:nicotinamidase/pyrazinamidase
MIQIHKKSALIVVDPQIDFCPDGALAVAGGDEIMQTVNELSFHFRGEGGVIVTTQDWHPAGHKSFASAHGVAPFSIVQLSYGDQVAWPDHCLQGTEGAEFHPDVEVTVLRSHAIIRKGMNRELDSYSAHYENDQITPTGLTGYLRSRGVEDVYYCGLARDFCVGFSALDGVKDGFNTLLIDDATRFIADKSNNDMTEKLIAAGVKFVAATDITSL